MKAFLLFAACFLTLTTAGLAASYQLILTSRDGEQRLAQQPLQEIGAIPDPNLPKIFVEPAIKFQTILGFGGAFTEAAAVTWQKLTVAERDQLIGLYFGDRIGLGYSLCRTQINSSDFSLSNYSYDDVSGDVNLDHFSIDHDKQALLPMIKAAISASSTPLKIFASPWSPPAWMKTNNDMNHGGKLKDADRAAWAKYFVRYLEDYKKQGIDIWGITVQNEPGATQSWDSCVYTAKEESDFVRDYLGPTLENSDVRGVKLMIWDHNRDLMVDFAASAYSDPNSSRYIWGTAYHWYGEDNFENVELHHDAWPTKNLLFTEGCQEGGPHTGEWIVGERYAHSIINDLNRWACGWVDWNMLLDQSGGPNHVGNFCSAPILADLKHKNLLIQPSYYYLGQFSRYLRPGASRILCSSSLEELEATAGVNVDGSVAIVVLNRTEQTQRFNLCSLNTATLTSLPPRSIGTYIARADDLR